MFEPKYEITNKILSGIVEIELCDAIIGLVPNENAWETKLKQDCLCRRGLYAMQFTGCEMGLAEISKIVIDEPGRDERPEDVAKRNNIVAKERDIQVLLNWLNADRFVKQLGFLGDKTGQIDFGKKNLSQINALLMERLVPSSSLGTWREGSVVGETRISPGKELRSIEMTYQMEDYWRWFIGADKKVMHCVLKAGICFYELMRMCPFERGNTLTAMFWAMLVLDSGGINKRRMVSVEEEILRNRESLLKSWKMVEDNVSDLTPWLEFFVGSVAEAAKKAKIKLLNLAGGVSVFKSNGKVIALSERQIVLMDALTLQGEMTIREVRQVLPLISDDTILRDLKNLVEKKLVKKKGKTKGARYTMGRITSYK